MVIDAIEKRKTVKIEKADIKALITTVCELKALAANECPQQYKEHLNRLAQHVRKVYMLLLKTADENGIFTITELYQELKPTDPIAIAIFEMAPLACSGV